MSLPGSRASSAWDEVNGIQWDGRYWVIDDYYLYRVSIANAQGYYVGETTLEVFSGPGPFAIYNANPKKQGTQLVGVYNGGIDYWNYPAGGDDIAQIYKGSTIPSPGG